MADLQRYERISRSFFPFTAFRQLRHGPRSDALFARCLVNACKNFRLRGLRGKQKYIVVRCRYEQGNQKTNAPVVRWNITYGER